MNFETAPIRFKCRHVFAPSAWWLLKLTSSSLCAALERTKRDKAQKGTKVTQTQPTFEK